MLRILALVSLPCAPAAQALTTTLEDPEAQVNARAATLAGHEACLRDPDPDRAMAAFQIMLESGDRVLVQLAMSIGVYSPDADIRQTALKAFFSGQPILDPFFQGADMGRNAKTIFRDG